MRRDQPPRPVAVGDVVAVYSEALGAWTASQVTGIDTAAQCVAVLELAWSGPEPETVADLGDVQPLRLTHHSWGGKLSHSNHRWVLPRSFTVIGSLPSLVTAPSYSYSPTWGRGEQLARQRHWNSGCREDWNAPYALTCTADELADEHTRDVVRAGVKHLTIRGITRLDCARLVAVFPNLTRLSLSGILGTLTSAAALNQLPRLQGLTISDLFGMAPSDCLLPHHVPEMEEVSLYGIPADYAAAMRKSWRPHVRHGVELDVRGARKPLRHVPAVSVPGLSRRRARTSGGSPGWWRPTSCRYWSTPVPRRASTPCQPGRRATSPGLIGAARSNSPRRVDLVARELCNRG
ncbi:hypothetical protein ABZ445_36015 [Streptomyces chartreusis]|uniref:hypothetical protein n=1 Tax=Streptomyces chartreusis TaxID=1969 RepID=UPI0033CEB8C1